MTNEENIIELFTGYEDMEDLCSTAIKNNKTGFIKFVLENDLQDFDNWSDFICLHIEPEMYDLFSDTKYSDILDTNAFAEYGNLVVLEHIYELTEEYPGLDGYNAANANGHTDVIEWINEVATDKLYE